jgi:hypothetical protein
MKSENGRIKGDLKYRTKKFALNIIEIYSSLPRRRAALVIGDQLLRSGTSANLVTRNFTTTVTLELFSPKKYDYLSEVY